MDNGVREGNKLYLSKSGVLRNYLILFIFVCTVSVILYLLPEEYRATGMFYILFIISSVGSMWISQYTKTPVIQLFWFTLSFFIVLFVLAFRKVSGIDDPTYFEYFNSADGVSLSAYLNMSEMEFGYKLLNYLIYGLFNGNYYIFQVTCSFIPIFFFYRSFWRYKRFIHLPSALFLLICLYYFQMLSAAIIRLFIALGFVFWALQYIWQKKPLHYTVYIILAALFHISAIIMLFLCLFAPKRKSIIKQCKEFTIIMLFALPLIFVIIARFIAPMLGARYAGYTEIGSLNISISDFDTLPFVIAGISLRKYIPNEFFLRYFLLLTLLALSSIFSLYSSMVSFGRLIFYTNLGMLLVIPMAYYFIPSYKPLSKLGFACIILVYGFLYVSRTQFFLELHIQNLFPYQNIFFTL